MPVRFLEGEAPLFSGHIISRLREMATGQIEKVEKIEEPPEEETPEGNLIMRINFSYMFKTAGQTFGTKNQLICTKTRDEEFYRVALICAPLTLGTPESWIDRTVKIVHDMSLDWTRRRR